MSNFESKKLQPTIPQMAVDNKLEGDGRLKQFRKVYCDFEKAEDCN
jgi:hypothetical protein